MKPKLTAATGSMALCISLALSAALFSGGASAEAQTQAAEQSIEAVKPVKKKLSRRERNKLDGVECKRVRETGSRVAKKVCTTSAQRAALARRERDKVNALEDRAIITTPGAN